MDNIYTQEMIMTRQRGRDAVSLGVMDLVSLSDIQTYERIIVALETELLEMAVQEVVLTDAEKYRRAKDGV